LSAKIFHEPCGRYAGLEHPFLIGSTTPLLGQRYERTVLLDQPGAAIVVPSSSRRR
jgi:hypothetical protein